MTWTLSNSGTETLTAPATAAFTNGSANIGVTQNAQAGDMVTFTSSGTLPTNFALFTTYFVIATGLSGTNIQVSLTQGGSAVTAGSAGSGTQTATFEQVLAVDTNNASFAPFVDMTPMVLGDVIEVRIYVINLTGGTLKQMWKGAFQGVQLNPIKALPVFASDLSCQVTLRAVTAGGRAIGWKYLRI